MGYIKKAVVVFLGVLFLGLPSFADPQAIIDLIRSKQLLDGGFGHDSVTCQVISSLRRAGVSLNFARTGGKTAQEWVNSAISHPTPVQSNPQETPEQQKFNTLARRLDLIAGCTTEGNPVVGRYLLDAYNAYAQIINPPANVRVTFLGLGMQAKNGCVLDTRIAERFTPKSWQDCSIVLGPYLNATTQTVSFIPGKPFDNDLTARLILRRAVNVTIARSSLQATQHQNGAFAWRSDLDASAENPDSTALCAEALYNTQAYTKALQYINQLPISNMNLLSLAAVLDLLTYTP